MSPDPPCLNRFQRIRLLGERMMQLSRGERPFVTVPDGVFDFLIVAQMEYNQGHLTAKGVALYPPPKITVCKGTEQPPSPFRQQ